MAGIQRTTHLARVVRVVCSALFAVSLLGLNVANHAAADQLQQRTLRIATSNPGVATIHEFSFTYSGANSVGSISFQYCDDPLPGDPCNTPSGINVGGVNLASQSGETGFSIYSATGSQIILTRPTAPAAAVASDYTFTNAVNPSASNQTFFVRISTYASTDGTGPSEDFGTVANSTSQTVTINTEVPQILKFCVGITIGADCSAAQGNFIQLGDLSSDRTSTGTSQFWVGTNAQSGFAVTTSGTTMTSGNNVIASLSQPTESAAGNAQFGINLRANQNPAIGDDPTGPGDSQPAANYNTANKFMYQPGDAIVQWPTSTNDRKFTVSYIVNVPADQAPGVYSTTITYICSATF